MDDEQGEQAYDGGEFYLYALIDPRVYRQTRSQLLSIFYVGKGTKSRAEAHRKDELRDLKKARDVLQRAGSKTARIDQILGTGDEVDAIHLSGGYRNEQDAYRAEALAMELIERLLRGYKLDGLTNTAPGHGQSSGMTSTITGAALESEAALRQLGVHDVDAEPEFAWRTVRQALQASTSRRRDWGSVITSPTILVKGSTASMDGGSHDPTAGGAPAWLTALGDRRVQILDADYAPGTEFERPGWDPDDPWDDLSAQLRGRRYWPIAQDRVRAWLEDPASCPSHLLLAIPGNGGTTVRYAWHVDAAGRWEYYPEIKRWGVPLGKRDFDHPALGVCLVEEKNGREQQVLQGYAAGIRVLDPT